MPGFGGFYKGEKKKAKKTKEVAKSISSNAPTFVMPEIISKNKKNWQ